MSIDAIIFDYGKVLSLPPTQENWLRLAKPFGVPFSDFEREYWRLRYGYDCGTLDGEGYWREMARVFHIALNNEQIQQITAWDNAQWTVSNPVMVDFARRTHASGMKTAILSNMQRELHDFMKHKFKWLAEGIFDVQVYSYMVGIAKPEPKIYTDLCEQLKTDPGKTLFLDDKQPNIDGAHKAGLQAMLFNGKSGADRDAVEHILAEQNGKAL